MAKFITRTTRGLPGTSGAVRANLPTDDGSAALGAATAAVGGQVQRIGGEIERADVQREKELAAITLKRQQMTDANEAAIAKSNRDIADQDFQNFKTVNPQETWQAERERINADVAEKNAGLNLSPEAMEAESIKGQAWSAVNQRKALGDATRQLQADTIDSLTDSMTNAFRSGSALDQAEAATVFAENGANMGKDRNEVLADIKAAKEAGAALKNKDAVEALGNEAVSNPVATLDKVIAEQAARKDGDGVIPESELSDQDLVTAERVSRNRIDEIERNTKEGVNDAQEKEENRLFQGLDDGSMTSADVINSDVLDVAAKRRLLDDESQFTKMDLSSTWPLIDDDSTSQELNTMLTDQSSGLLSINDTYKAINTAAASGKLTKGTRDKLREQAKKGGLDAIDEQVNASTLRVKNALIGRLTAREARFKVIEASRSFSRAEQQQARATGFLVQVGFEQLNRFSAELNKRLRESGKENLSGTETEAVAAKVWDKYKKKDDATKIREFMEFTGQRVPRPDSFPEATWNEATASDRANITAAMADGMTAKQVLDMVSE